MILRPAEQPGRSRPGLSLIEVLLSLAILMMSLVAIGKLVDIGSDRGQEARLHTTAARLAQGKMGEYEAGLASLADGSASGSFTDSDEGWQWEMSCALHDTIPNLYVVSVTVSRTLRGKPFEFTLSQMMLDPAVKGSAAAATRPSTTSGATQ